ncbi:MAG: FAD-binding oxidoreductase [Solirubrobacteraceae bacterium]
MSQTSSVVAELEHGLRDALTEGRVLSDASDLDRYTADTFWKSLYFQARGEPLGRPQLVVVPANAGEVAATVALANQTQTPLVPWGGGSGTQGAVVPTEGGIVLDLRGMNRILKVDEVSLTATVQAGLNGRAFEKHLNERGLMFPHYPASAEWATVGGYVAARGSGVLSTRYGKIEDLLLSLSVVTPTGEVISTVPAPRHAVGPELTQLYVGSEGTLGVITEATVQLVRLPARRRFDAVLFSDVTSGVATIRESLQRGHRPSVVRMYDPVATRATLDPVVHTEVEGVCALLVFEGEEAAVEVEATATLRLAAEHGGQPLDSELSRTWWERRYDFYEPPHHPALPAIWGTMDVVASYSRIEAVYEALQTAVAKPYADLGLELRAHFSHWYHWGTMIYARFVIPGAAEREDAEALHDEIWRAGVEAAMAAGAVFNDHHGVGIKLAPFMRPQWGAAFDQLERIKQGLDPNNIMNPGKLGFAP